MSQTEVQLIKAAAVVTGDIADQAVTLDKLPHGTSSNDGKFLRANNGADPTFETVNTDLVSDTSPQLGGDLASNGNNVVFADGDQARFGTGNDMNIFHSGDVNQITTGTKIFKIFGGGSNNKTIFATATTNAAELYFDNSKKLETTSEGVLIGNGGLHLGDNNKIEIGNGDDLQIYHDGSDSYISNVGTGELIIQPTTSETAAVFRTNGSVELFHDNTKKFETQSAGAQLFGNLTVGTDGGAILLTNPDGFSPKLQENAGSLEFYTNNSLRMSLGHGGNLLFQDNRKAEFGASSDFQIYHDGTHNEIRSNGAKTIHIRPKDSDVGIALVPDGEVELYYDNSLKLSTETYGVSLHGLTLSTAGNILYYNSSTGQVTYQSAPSSGAPLANDGNNRIVTATGSGGLNGESTLTYDGSTLTNTGNTSFNRVTAGFTADTGGSIHCSNVHTAAAQFNRSGSGGRIVDIYNTVNSSSIVASIQGNHGQGSFNNHSDYRSKENVVPITDGITQLKKLKPSRFNFKSDAAKYVIDGFLAHEVTPAVPCAVSGEKDGMMPLTYYEEGDTLPEGKYIGDPKTISTTEIEQQTLDYSKLTPILTAALQETLTKVETLETEVAALKAA